MTEQNDNQISFQPIRMLELFPTRKIQSLDFDLQKYKKLYDVLNCSLCKQIFNNPTYLRCSHRFCKDCIEKHIRNNEKRSCPVCRAQIATKRDSKLDLRLISLISFAYGDATVLQQDINKCQEEALKNFRFVKTKSGIQMQLKRDRPQSMDNKSKATQIPSRKRKKDNQQSEQKQQQKKLLLIDKQNTLKKEDIQQKDESESKNKKIQSSIREEDKSDSQVQILTKPTSQNKSKDTKNKQTSATKSTPNWQNTKNKSNKKKAEVIQIFSQCSHQIQIPPDKNNQVKETIQSKQIITSLQKHVAQNKIIQQNITKNIQINNKTSIQQNTQTLISKLPYKNFQQRFFENNKFEPKVLQARNKLKQNLGQQYLKVLLKKTQKICSINITLVPHPKSKLIPPLPKKNFQLSLNFNLSKLTSIILNQLNIPNINSQKIIQFSLITKQNKQQLLISQNLTIMNILQKYWKDYKGIGIFNILNTVKNQANRKQKNSRFLYYSINYQQIYKAMENIT